MQKIKLILSSILLFSSLSILAQANNYDRTDTRANRNRDSKLDYEKRKENFEKEKIKNIEKSVAKLKIDLELDDLQVIAIKQIITESVRIEGIILKKEDSDEEKMKAITALSETTNTQIKALLNKEQNEKFIALNENLKKKRK